MISYDEASGVALFEQRNKISVGDTVEVLVPGKVGFRFVATALTDEDGVAIESAPHPRMRFCMPVPVPVSMGDLLRGG